MPPEGFVGRVVEPVPQQVHYAAIRGRLPEAAFRPDLSKVWILLINVTILLLGWNLARGLDHWPGYAVLLYLPFALVMGNSVLLCLFCSHDILHTNTIRNPTLRWLVSLIGLCLFWMPPSLWRVLHNREHHGKTNSIEDPDRNYLFDQPASWGKWIQDRFVPSSEVNPLLLGIGMTQSWGIHTSRQLFSILFFNSGTSCQPPASFRVKPRQRLEIALELSLMVLLHLALIAWIGLTLNADGGVQATFAWQKILLGYFLPIWIGHAAAMFYIYSNHMLCSMSSVNDPLLNTISVKVPRIFDLLHLNFSYHIEHHVCPNVNSSFYPQVRELLRSDHPDRYRLLPIGAVWSLLRSTPRHYRDAGTFTDATGTKSVPCPLG